MTVPEKGAGAVGSQLRGSGLLLAGRILSKGLNFAIQVAIIRLLTKDDFGAFAYGLALAGAGELLVKIGLGHGVNRFVPYYFERGEYGKVLGSLALVTGMVFIMGTLAVGLFWWVSNQGWSGVPAGTGAMVVLVLAVLAPVQALDAVCIQTLACFAKARQIAFRKHVFGPLLRMTAVTVAFVAGGDPLVLAVAYLLGGVLGLAVCVSLMLREMVRQKVLPRPIRQWQVPLRSLVNFSIPLISSDLVVICLTGVTTVLLMWTSGESEIATMRAVVPAAALNMLAVQSFTILFLPAAARLFARDDHAGLSDHHWESVAWVSVLSFPVFALTFAVAPEVVTLLFGVAYADSALVLAILSVGTFASVAMAFSAETLQVAHRTGALVWSNCLTIVLSVTLAWQLCEPYGALGAAIAVTVGRVVGVVCRQVVLLRTGVVGRHPAGITQIWLWLAGMTMIMFVVGWIWRPHLIIQAAVLGVATLVLLRSCAHTLDIGRTFPELRKLPLLGKLVST